MNQHPMTKAFIKAFCSNGGKEFKPKFNPFSMDQTFTFGYRTFRYRVRSVGCVLSHDQHLIPEGVTSQFNVILLPDVCNGLGDWLSCDDQARSEFERFEAIVKTTFAECE